MNDDEDPSGTRFLAHGLEYSVFLSPTKAAMVFPVRGSFPLNHRTIQLEWVNADSSGGRMTGHQPQKGFTNYLLGDRAKWHRRMTQFARAEERNLYPGIDVAYYGSQQQLEFDLLLHRGADPHRIRLAINGVYKTELKTDGEISLQLQEGEVRLKKPQIYQPRGRSRDHVDGHYVMLADNQVGFELGSYDRNRPVIIDPVLSYAMIFGGTQGFSNDLLTGMALDGSGNAYLTGATCAPDFQVTPGAFQTVGGLAANFGFTCKDVFVMKVNSTATSLLYSTYLGGSQMDVPTRIAVDSAGSAYVTGGTQSADFPVTAGAYDTVFKNPGGCSSDIFSGCTDAFVTKLSADGSTLLYSTYLGGSKIDFGLAIALDSADNTYVGGATNSSDFPVSTGAIQQTYGGGSCNSEPCFDGFLAKLSADGKSLTYSTYLGGNDDDYVSGVAVNSSGQAYLSGGTGSTNFPVTASAYQTQLAGTVDNTDSFMAKVNSTATQLLYSTYLGGSNTDYATSVAIDSAGNAYIAGASGSPDFPVTGGVYQPVYAGPASASCSFSISSADSAACGDAFLAKLNPANSGAASLIWSTYLGGNSNDIAYGIAIDSAKNVWVAGEALSSNFPTTANAYVQSGFAGPFVSELNSNATALVFSTMLATGSSMTTGIATDAHGNAYVSGTGQVSPTAGVYPSAGHDFVAKFSPGTAPTVSLSPNTLTFGSQPIGSTSAPQTVLLKNTGTTALALSVAADFVNYSETNNCGSSLASGSSCTINVTFTPTTTGSPGGYIHVVDNAPGSPHSVILGGTATTATVARVSPTLLNFGNQAIATHSLSQAVTLTNHGTATLNISSIAASAPFSVSSTSCGTTLAASGSCKINVKFSPPASGAFSGTLSVQDDAAGSLQTSALLGNGVSGAAANLFPTSLTFPPQAPGTKSAPKNVVLVNSGNASLDITGVLLRSDFAETTTCGSTLAPAGKCTFSVVYSPKVAGPHSGSMVIADNANNEPQVVTLTGLGPAITFSKNSINFGTVTVGQKSSPQTLFVENSGTSALHISNISLGGNDPGDFVISGGTCKNGTVLKMFAQCTVILVFQPTAAGFRNAQVLFTDDAANSPQTVGLQGTGQ